MLIVNNFLSYSGMEMNAVHVSSLREPGKEFPKAIFFASGLVMLIFILPALAISWVVPAEQLSLTAGIMQAFEAIFANFGIQWLTPIFGLMIVTASLGGMLTWLAGPSKGLLLISRQEGYLPPFLQKMNKNGVQQNILVTQGVITTLIGLGYALVPTVSSAYWIFSVITTQVYLIMYLLMFVAAVRLRRKEPDHPRGYRAPILGALCGVGFAASLAALLIGFIPPSQIESGSGGAYFAIVAAGALGLGLLVPFLFYRFRKPSWKQPEQPESGGEPVMSTVEETSTQNHRRVTYIVITVALVLLLIICLVFYRRAEANQEAQDKANQLIAALQQAGVRAVPSQEQIAGVLGDDGGAICKDPASALRQALVFSQLTNGAGGPGIRPVIADSKIFKGELLVIQIYCPDELPQFQQMVEQLKTAGVAGG